MKTLLKLLTALTLTVATANAQSLEDSLLNNNVPAEVEIKTTKITPVKEVVDTRTGLEKFLGKGEKDKGVSIIFAGYANHGKKKCDYCKGGKLNETIKMIGIKYGINENFGVEWHNFTNSYHKRTNYVGAYAKYNFFESGKLRTFVKVSAGVQKGYKNWKMDYSEGNDGLSMYFMPAFGINYDKLTIEAVATVSREHGSVVLATASWKLFN